MFEKFWIFGGYLLSGVSRFSIHIFFSAKCSTDQILEPYALPGIYEAEKVVTAFPILRFCKANITNFLGV